MKKYFTLAGVLFLLFITSTPTQAQQTCPEGFTCPDTSPTPIPGEKIHYETTLPVGTEPKGETGPETNQLKVPELKEENTFYSQQELMYRALPLEFQSQLKFDPQHFNAEIAHPGCGKTYIDGKESGNTEFDQTGDKVTKFETTPSYDNLLLVSRFWQSIFVPNSGSTLKFTAVKPDNFPITPNNSGNCVTDTGASLEELKSPNSPPPKLDLFGGILKTLTDLFGGWSCFINSLGKQEGKCTYDIALDLQQIKLIPGEKSFDNQTVGDSGFLNFFKPKSIPYTKDGKERDEDEKTNYKVLGKDPNAVKNGPAGVTYEGMASFQTGSVDMIRAMYPAQFASSIQSLPNQNNTEYGGLNYTLPYTDTTVAINKDKVIQLVKKSWSDSPIDQLWDTVFQKSVAAGINPAFTIAIWIEESGASSPGVKAQSPFGCFPNGDTNQTVGFDRSLNCFIGFTNSHKTDFQDWMRYFCGPSTVSICSNNQYFSGNLKEWYDDITRP